MKIGFIGQGWIGKNYADDFENRGYEVVRFALEEPFVQNKEAIKTCDLAFIAVPTPTTPEGFSYEAVVDALNNLSGGTIAVIKSTLVPGTTTELQQRFPQLTVLHSPEFLVEKTANHDAANPQRNIIGIPEDTPHHRAAAEQVLRVLPSAPYQVIVGSREAEFIKYAGNCFLYTKVLFMNMLYDAAAQSGAAYDVIAEALMHDPRIGTSHMQPVHNSGRGAGGHCFIKDFEAFRRFYKETVGADEAFNLLSAHVTYNNFLLRSTSKDLNLLEDVYGEGVIDVTRID